MTDDLLKYQVVERKDAPGTWSVEAIFSERDGECYLTVFYGPGSERRAREYAKIKEYRRKRR